MFSNTKIKSEVNDEYNVKEVSTKSVKTKDLNPWFDSFPINTDK